MRIDDRVFIVTGASSGIGLATARALAARGGKVALVARSTHALHDLATTLPGSLAVTADMTDFDGIRRVVADIHRHYGRIDSGSCILAGIVAAHRDITTQDADTGYTATGGVRVRRNFLGAQT